MWALRAIEEVAGGTFALAFIAAVVYALAEITGR